MAEDWSERSADLLEYLAHSFCRRLRQEVLQRASERDSTDGFASVPLARAWAAGGGASAACMESEARSIRNGNTYRMCGLDSFLHGLYYSGAYSTMHSGLRDSAVARSDCAYSCGWWSGDSENPISEPVFPLRSGAGFD